MINKIICTVALGVFVSLASCTAQSNDQRPPRPEKGKPPTFAQLLKDLDANKDGKLSKSEVRGPLKDDFDKVDANKDGFIEEAELKKMKPPRRPKPDGKEGS